MKALLVHVRFNAAQIHALRSRIPAFASSFTPNAMGRRPGSRHTAALNQSSRRDRTPAGSVWAVGTAVHPRTVSRNGRARAHGRVARSVRLPCSTMFASAEPPALDARRAGPLPRHIASRTRGRESLEPGRPRSIVLFDIQPLKLPLPSHSQTSTARSSGDLALGVGEFVMYVPFRSTDDEDHGR